MTTEPASLDRDASAKKAAPERSPRPLDAVGAESPKRSPGRWLLPLLAIAVGVALYFVLVATREKPVTADFTPVSPLVRVQEVELQSFRLSVLTRGTVKPRTESDLVAEVSGRILSLSPKLVVGGFFEAGDELLRLDDREHRIARDRARATVTLRKSEARLAEAEAKRRRQLRQRGAASAGELDQFESRELVARASLAEARAALEKAELDLERTVVRAPFDGRVREREVDVGRFVSPGTKLGRIFAVDYAEVRLPIQTDDLAFLQRDMAGATSGSAPGGKRGDGGLEGRSGLEGARVRLTGRLGGRDYHWPARLERAEAAIDERTRMLHVVARVENPYALSAFDSPDGPEREASVEWLSDSVPLPSGLFVQAEIEGRLVSDVIVLPLMALRDGDQVFVFEPERVDGKEGADGAGPERSEASTDQAALAAVTGAVRQGRLRVRPVSVLRRDRDRFVIEGGLETGEQVIMSPLRIHSDGMRLRAVEAEDS